MSIRIAGSDWDVAMLRALAAHPPPPYGEGARHRHAVRLLAETIGDDVKLFLRCHGARYAARWRHPSDPFVAMVSRLAGYYLSLHDILRHGPREVLPGWDEAVADVRARIGTTRLVLTTQLGHALMVPLLVEEATGRPVLPIVHDRNPLVREMYAKRLRRGEPLLLTRLGSADIRRWLGSDAVMVANLDTCYPGTRHVRTLSVLGGRLDVPTGLLALAARRKLDTRAVAAPEVAGRITPRVGDRLPGSLDAALDAYGAWLDRCVSAAPEQWMAWGSLLAPHLDTPDTPDTPRETPRSIDETEGEDRGEHLGERVGEHAGEGGGADTGEARAGVGAVVERATVHHDVPRRERSAHRRPVPGHGDGFSAA
ncbi:hypothetical protein OG259_02955 [Streptomyces sp. NBC_00250]|uniref:hypothetical protein n=1 Tax=Streptomyces sp. NBC_00250 TaxID=2903641 RepID=UPI002E281DEC|nr:hypothetical protein [Streptomyces sp. NBC_00250]